MIFDKNPLWRAVNARSLVVYVNAYADKLALRAVPQECTRSVFRSRSSSEADPWIPQSVVLEPSCGPSYWLLVAKSSTRPVLFYSLFLVPVLQAVHYMRKKGCLQSGRLSERAASEVYCPLCDLLQNRCTELALPKPVGRDFPILALADTKLDSTTAASMAGVVSQTALHG